jgi:glycine betaine transporter
MSHDLPIRHTSAGAWSLGLSAILALIFLSGGQPLIAALQTIAEHGKQIFGRSILIICSVFLIGLLVLALSPWGKLRLGRPDERPEFSLISWVAMLFAAGMGAGLVFWGMAEPVLHTLHPPRVDLVPGSADSAAFAMALTLLHWTLHPWAIYATGGLILAFVAFRHDLPLLPSTPFRLIWPQARRRLRIIDILAALGVLFGLAAGIAQGVYQMDAGLSALHATEHLAQRQVTFSLCLLLTIVYTLSASGRLENSIRVLSLVNVWLAAAFALVLLLAGAGASSFAFTIAGAKEYVALLPATLFQRLPGSAPTWSNDWTITYFLSWISWVPLMSIFLARISRGRTIRSFICGVVLLPSLVTVVWFGILGGNGLSFLLEGRLPAAANIAGQEARALFLFLEQFPLATLFSGLALVLIFIFLVTSADSGAYVLAMLASHKNTPSPRLKIAWGGVLGILSLAFVWGGDSVAAVRAMFALGALPILAVMLGQILSIIYQSILLWHGIQRADTAEDTPPTRPQRLQEQARRSR